MPTRAGLKNLTGKSPPAATPQGEPREPLTRPLGPNAATTAAEGRNDTFRQQLGAVSDAAKDAGQLKQLVLDATNAIERAVRTVWVLADEFVASFRANSAATSQGAAMVQGMAPLQDKARQLRANVSRSVRDEVLAKGADEATQTANEVRGAIEALVEGIGRARLDYYAPASLSSDPAQSLVALIQEQRALSDLEAMTTQALAALYHDSIKFGDAAKQKTLEEILPQIVKKRLLVPAPKLAAQARAQGSFQTDNSTELGQLRRLLAEIEQAKRDGEPEFIRVAEQCVEALRPIFLAVVGRDVRFMGRAEFANRYLSPGNAPSTWEIDPKYPIRRIDDNGQVDLPGWSPVIARDGSGNPVREPAAGIAAGLGMKPGSI